MEIEIVNNGDSSVMLVCTGRIDTISSPALESAISRNCPRKDGTLACNMRDVDYISSAGLRVLLSAAKDLSSHGGRFVICCPSDHVMKVLEIAGFDRIFTIVHDEKEAFHTT